MKETTKSLTGSEPQQTQMF